MAAQVTGLNPIAALSQHLSDPMNTSEPRRHLLPRLQHTLCFSPFRRPTLLCLARADMFAKAAVVPGMAVAPPCAIPDSVQFNGITIPAGCFLQALWP
jgi:light-harvesting complex I chlorophyll a/b binding protein 4